MKIKILDRVSSLPPIDSFLVCEVGAVYVRYVGLNFGKGLWNVYESGPLPLNGERRNTRGV